MLARLFLEKLLFQMSDCAAITTTANLLYVHDCRAKEPKHDNETDAKKLRSDTENNGKEHHGCLSVRKKLKRCS